MQEDLQSQFIALLEERYGSWNKTTSRFGATPFGIISKDLHIGASQFSKLIYGTATEGMYERSIANIKRLLYIETLKAQLEEAEDSRAQVELKLNRRKNGRWLWMAISSTLALMALFTFVRWQQNKHKAKSSQEQSAQHPLAPFFDREFSANFNSPYLDISEVQFFCPGSAYEGIWALEQPYKLPLPGSKRPGLYYLGKSADVRMKVARYGKDSASRGQVLSGYEFLVNEIWVDTQMRPLSPSFFDKKRKQFTPTYDQLDFATDPSFQKVATIYSFFVDQFEITTDSIFRRGEPVGRFATDINEDLVNQYEIDIKYILENVIGDLTTAACHAIPNPFPNPNDLQEGQSVMQFDCLYTITNENLGIGGGYPYQKGYRLVQQNYADNLYCRD